MKGFTFMSKLYIFEFSGDSYGIAMQYIITTTIEKAQEIADQNTDYTWEYVSCHEITEGYTITVIE